MFAFTLTLTILATSKVAVISFCFIIGFLAAIFNDEADTDVTAVQVIKVVISFMLSLGISIWGWIILLF